MNNLEGFLKKFKSALGVLNLEKDLISSELSTALGLKIPNESFTIKNDIVFISGGASLKSHIFLKRNQILEGFAKHPELKKIKDIR